jgi:hypothetical protein
MSKLLEKVISTTTIGTPPNGGGLLRPDQSQTFIDYMWDATTLGAQVRKVAMRGNEQEVNRMAVGERVVRLATEAVDDAINVKVAFAKVSLSTQKLRLDWELSSDALEDNIEGAAFETHVAQLLSAQAANDIEDLAINGDVDNVNDALFKSFDGWRKRLYSGAQVVDAQGASLDRAVFHKALMKMPRKFMGGRASLKWFTSTGLLTDYVYNFETVEGISGPTPYIQESDRQNALSNPRAGDTPGWSPAAPYGIRAQEVPLFADYDYNGAGTDNDGRASDVWLVDPKNLLWGVKREIQIFRQFVPRKDAIEYTMFTRVGTAIENPNAAVLVKNVGYRD